MISEVPSDDRVATVPVVVALSGGGFRASLAGLGVLRFLADVGILGRVELVSAVSGGSWPAGLLALRWDDLADRGFTTEAVDDQLIRPFVEQVTTTSLEGRMLSRLLTTLGPRTRTDLLADAFDDWFGHGRRLADLPQDCRFAFNATNLRTGKRFVFEKDRVGDYEIGYQAIPELRIADALAASAAIPGALSVQPLRKPHRYRYPRRSRPRLVDGAVYDNLGTEPFHHLRRQDQLLVSIDSGAVLRRGLREEYGLVGVLRRSQAVVQSQTSLLRRRWLVEQFRLWQAWRRMSPDDHAAYTADPDTAYEAFMAWDETGPRPPWPPDTARRGVAFSLDSSTQAGLAASIAPTRYDLASGPPEVPPWCRDDADGFISSVAHMPMSVKRLPIDQCRDCIYRAWWLARAFLTTYHGDLIPDAPGWTEWYQGSSRTAATGRVAVP